MVVFVRLPDNALPRLAVRRLLDLVVAGNLGQGRGRRRGGRRLEEVREVGGGAGAEGGVVVDIHGGAARAVVLQLVLVLLGRGMLRVRSGASTQLDRFCLNVTSELTLSSMEVRLTHWQAEWCTEAAYK